MMSEAERHDLKTWFDERITTMEEHVRETRVIVGGGIVDGKVVRGLGDRVEDLENAEGARKKLTLGAVSAALASAIAAVIKHH